MILTPKSRIKEYTDNGWWNSDTLYSLFIEACSESGNKEALVDAPNRELLTNSKPRRLSFLDVQKEVDNYASILFELGFRKDDKIILQLPNIVELAILYIAMSKLGIIISPVPVQYGKYELEKIIDDINPKGYIGIGIFNGKNFTKDIYPAFNKDHTLLSIGAAEGFVDLSTFPTKNNDDEIDAYLKAMDYSSNDILTICWTSGTTGTPKGVPRSHNLWGTMARAAYHLANTQKGDILLNPFPLVNMASIGGFLFNWLICQGKLVQHHPFDLQIYLNQMAEEKVNYTIAAPAIMNMLLNNKNLFENLDLTNLRSIGCGGAPLSEWMVETFQNEHDITIQNIFGSNEGMSLFSTRDDVEDPALRAVYFPRFGVEGFEWNNPISKTIKTKLIDLETNEEITKAELPGELLIAGSTVFDGYWNAPEANIEVFDDQGFFRTGDMFEISSDQTNNKFYKYCGRCKDLIIRGGMNISPEELDYLLISHPSILDVAVTGYDDELLGEKVGVVAVLQEGAELELKDITAFLQELGIAKYKFPEDIKIIKELPRNPVGKVLRRNLKDLF
ncbi:acyl--CoA ligase [Pseudomonadota bacterium]|nr:acyl--CoA ligase [Pseudomonadota bacterium]